MPRETPLPAVLAAPSAFDLAGRADELDALVDAWKESAEGAAQGRAARRRARHRQDPPRRRDRARRAPQARSCSAAGATRSSALPYQPFVEALRFQSELDDVPPTWLGPLAGELARLVPELADRVPGLSRAGARPTPSRSARACSRP